MPDKAIDHAEAEPGSLADFLGREERLESPIPHLGRHSAAGIADGQPDIRSGQAPGHCPLCQDDVPGFDLEHAAVGHGVARIQGKVEERGLQLSRVDVAEPQSFIGHQLDFASFSDRSSDERLELPNKVVCADRLGRQPLAPRKSQQLRRQSFALSGGMPRSRDQLPDPAAIRRAVVDQLEVGRNHREQVVEVVRHAAGKLADGLHLLALVELLLHQATRLHGLLVLRDIPEIDDQALIGRERVDCVPPVGPIAEHLERDRTPIRQRFTKPAAGPRLDSIGESLQHGHADDVAGSGDLSLCTLVEVADAPVFIHNDHAVGRAFKDLRDPGRSLLSFLLRLVQFVLALLQRVSHRVECSGDSGDLRVSGDLHAPSIIAEPPLIGGVGQLAERPTDEPLGANPCERKHQRGAQDDESEIASRALLDLAECLRLVHAHADKDVSGIGPERRQTDDPLDAVGIEHVRHNIVRLRKGMGRHLSADKSPVVRIASEISAVAIRDRERGSCRNTFLGDVVSEPVQTETRDDNAAHASIVAVERQRELNDVFAGRQARREFSDREGTALQHAGIIWPPRDVDRSVIVVRVAERASIQIGDEESDKGGKSPMHRGQIAVACLAVLRLDRWKLRQRDQDLPNSLDDLLLLRCGQLCQTKRLILHLDLTRTAQVKLVVQLNRNRRQQRHRYQGEQPR